MINLDIIKKIYFIGIKGSGVSSLAEFLHKKGYEVTGSDIPKEFYTQKSLESENIIFYEDFNVNNITNDIDLVVHSTAYNVDNNIEIKEALQKDIKIVSYPEMLAFLFNSHYGIAVTGTDGKSTTSAMLSVALNEIGLKPNAIIGTTMSQYKKGYLSGDNNLFVIEADEYQNKLKLYYPKVTILTTINYDHPDFFKTKEDYVQVFKDFINKVPKDGILICCVDEPEIRNIIENIDCKVVTYGFSEDADYTAKNLQTLCRRNCFDVYKNNDHASGGHSKLGNISLQFPGKHNILNSLAVIACLDFFRVDFEKTANSLRIFSGTARRFERKGEFKNALLVDDYAHTPKEIKATLEATKEFFPDKKIYCVFQPHTFSRTEMFLEEFSEAFDKADLAIILDIFASAREHFAVQRVSSKDLVDKISLRGVESFHLKTVEEAADYFSKHLNKDTVLLTLGAGDSYKVLDILLNLIK